MNPTKPTKKTRAQLEQKIYELEAQLIHCLHFADATLHKAGSDYLAGSAVIVELTVLGGRKICAPFAIDDGFSKETIDALKADMRRSFARKIELEPKGTQP